MRAVTGDEVALVEQARTRASRKFRRSDEAAALLGSAAVLAAAIAACLFLPAVRPLSPAALVLAVLTYALVSRVRFEVGNAFVMPTELVLVPMLLTLPPRAVPLLVAAGLVSGQAWEVVRGRLTLDKLPLSIMDASHSLGPAIVLSFFALGAPSWHSTPVYLLALPAQFAADFAANATWARTTWHISIRELARPARTVFAVDAALAPIGLAIALATHGRPWGVLLVLPLVRLFAFFARERQVRLDHALELSSAYRGTALLLGDVIEADDAYTGSHSRDVVELVLAVSDRIGLGPEERRQAEFAALLHDVGKVKIPLEIINKPGPLDEDERALMNTHTLLGEEMLHTIGGLLGEVGSVVRSCHEHWNGDGYPDGLAGEAIPLAARIVCACDAWSAMTSDRSYRKALPVEEAIAELRRCAGTHFDPAVVEALLAVLGA